MTLIMVDWTMQAPTDPISSMISFTFVQVSRVAILCWGAVVMHRNVFGGGPTR